MATHKLSLTAQREFFLLGVVLFYNSTNRAVDEHGMCVYHRTIASPGCAIGRRQPQLKNREGSVGSLTTCLDKDFLKLGIVFLDKIQKLHDNPSNWVKNGLSELGKENLTKITKQFKLNPKNFSSIFKNDKTQ